MKKVSLATLFLIILFVIATPWLLYAIGLWNVSGRPALPVDPIATDEAARIWIELSETGPVHMKPIGPWDYVLQFVVTGHSKINAGEKAAWFVARSWNSEHLKSRSMIYWHLSGAAMTIWLSQNWTAEEILSKAKEISLQSKKGAATIPLDGQIAIRCRLPYSEEHPLGFDLVEEGKFSEAAQMRKAPHPVTRVGKHVLMVHWSKGTQRFTDEAPYEEGEIGGSAWTYCGYNAALGLHLIEKNSEKSLTGVLLDENTGAILSAGYSVVFSPDRKSYFSYQNENADFPVLYLYTSAGKLVWHGSSCQLAAGEEGWPEHCDVYWSPLGKLLIAHRDSSKKKVVLALTIQADGSCSWLPEKQ